MDQNLISATFTAADAAIVEQLLNDVKAKLPFLSTLQGSEIKSLFKVGVVYLPMLDKVHEVVISHPEILPGVFDKEEFMRDYNLFKNLRSIHTLICELAEGIEKTYIAAGSDTLVEALDVYMAVKQNKDKVAGLSVVSDELAVFFKREKAKTVNTVK